MPTCKNCEATFPNWIEINGVKKNLSARSYCLGCSPWGRGNAKRLSKHKVISGVKHKRCATCERFLPEPCYHKGPKVEGKDYWQGSCKLCHNARALAIHHALKMRAIEYKGSKCSHCGLAFPPCVFQFHHRDPAEKDIKISHSKNRHKPWRKLKKELDKCDLVCANCHLIAHYGAPAVPDLP